MNILFITPSAPARTHQFRALNMIKYLSAQHKIFLISLSRDVHPDISEVSTFCPKIKIVHQPLYRSLLNCFIFLFMPVPLEVAYCRNRKMNSLVQEIIQTNAIDLVYIKRLRSVQYVDSKISIPMIIDTTDAMSLFYQRAFWSAPWYHNLLFLKEWVSYAHYEKKIFRQFKTWVACSEVDATYLRKRAPRDVSITVIPNGVDTDVFPRADHAPEHHTLILSGLMNKFVNIQAAEYFVRDILPLVEQKIPDVKVFIVGPNPSYSIKRLSRHNITVTGYVSDLQEYIEKNHIVIVPIRTGTGTRYKILQAWSVGRPVVTTSAGLEGLEAEHLRHAMVANTPQDFVQAICTLFENPTLSDQLVQNARKLVQEKYTLSRVGDMLSHYLETF